MGSFQDKSGAPNRPARGTSAQAPRQLLLVTAIQAMLVGMLPAMAWAQDAAEPARAAVTLPQVEVSAEREVSHREPGAVTTITAEQLEQAQGMDDVVRYEPLVSAPGVTTGGSRNKSSFDRGGTTGYNIRGVEGNRIGLDIDGVELPAAGSRPYVSRVGVNTAGIGRDFIDPEMYMGVQIDSGTTPARRTAGGIGGAVGFRSKAPEYYLQGGRTSYFNGKLSYDSADHSWNESVTAAGRSGDHDGLIAYSRRDGHAVSNNSSTVESYPNDWHSDALLLKGGVQVSADHRLVLSADIYRRENQSAYMGWDNARTAFSESSRQDSSTERNTLQLAHQWTPAQAWADRVETRLHLQITRTSDVTDTTQLTGGAVAHNVSGSETQAWGVSSSGEKRIGDHKLSAGFNASIEDSERPWAVSGYVKPQPDSTISRQGIFLQDEISFDAGGRRLALIPGLRVDRVEIESRNLEEFASSGLSQAGAEQLYGSPATSVIVSPSLALVYDLTPKFSAYAQYKRGGRTPSAGEFYGSWNNGSSTASYHLVGNRDIKPETSNTVDIGLKGAPTEGVRLNASAFYSKYKDFIAYTRYTRAANPDLFTNLPSNITILYQAENRDEATIYGFELSSRLEHGVWTPAMKGVYSSWALGMSRGTSTSSYEGDKDVALDSVQPAKAVVGVGYDAPQKSWGMHLIGTFVRSKQAIATNRETYNNSGTPLTDATTVLFKVPGYAVFDLGGYWQINKTWRMNAGIHNLGDKRYWDYASARSLQPAVTADRYDMELMTNPGRTYTVSLAATF